MIVGALRRLSILRRYPHVVFVGVEQRPYRVRMTQPPRPPGDANFPDPAEPLNPYSGNDPTSGSAPSSGPPPTEPPFTGPPPSSGPGGYGPPSSGHGAYAPPPSSAPGAYGPPPSSGPGAYGPPPSSGPGAYGSPPYGYGPPRGGPMPGGYSTEDERTWTLIAHFGGAVLAFISGGWLGWIAPLVAMLAKGNQSPVVRQQSVGALNFQLLWAAVALAITVISTCLSVI